MIDGLGFEEVNQSGLSTNLVQTVSGVHTRAIAANVIGTTDVSGLDVFATGSLVAGRLNDGNGALLPSSTGSPAVYGAMIQAGKAGPLLAATGSVVFGRQFSNQTFVVTVTPSESGTLPWSVASGNTTYTVSGITVNGQSGLSFHWTAVGV